MFELHQGQVSSTIIIRLPVDPSTANPLSSLFGVVNFQKFNKMVNLDENRQSVQITE